MNKKSQVISITGGKGGIGKSVLTANLAVSLAQQGFRIAIIDADFGLSNIDIIFNVEGRYHVGDLITGQCELDELIVDLPYGVKLIPAGKGIARCADFSLLDVQGLISIIDGLKEQFDIILIDTPAGISKTTRLLIQVSNIVNVIVCDEPTALADAYSVIKCCHRGHAVDNFKIITNNVKSLSQGVTLFNKLQSVVDRFLDLTLRHYGNIVHDPCMLKAVQNRKLLCDIYPSSPAILGLQQLSYCILNHLKFHQNLSPSVDHLNM